MRRSAASGSSGLSEGFPTTRRASSRAAPGFKRGQERSQGMVVIERFTGFIARHWRALVFWLIVVAAFFMWFLPNSETLMPFVMYGGYLVFQLLFAIMFMVVQFGAL